MIKVVSRSGYLGNWLKTTTSAGATSLLPLVPPVPEEEALKFPISPQKNTAYSSACAVPSKKMSVVCGPGITHQVRFNHTDVSTPDFTSYRRDDRKNPHQKSSDREATPKFYTCLAGVVGSAAGAYAAKSTIVAFVSSMAPSADVLALAKIEINKAEVPEGKNVTFKWRGKPLFVRHRTDDEIKTEESVDPATLRDPQRDSERVKDPKWLVVVGVCTHLGCVPIANQGDWGGYYCPCHGSHYDASGRIRKGPAPLNLEVPSYEINNDLIVVG